MNLGERIKIARENAGLTQEELGKKCGTTKQTIYKYETGAVTNIPIDKLEVIAGAVNVPAARLLGWEMEQPTVENDGLPKAKKAMYEFLDTLSEDQISRLLQIGQTAFEK